jgi:hypothetical protein
LSDDYWLAALGKLGAVGADISGNSDAAEALNAAVAGWNKNSVGGAKTRCSEQ